MRKKVIIEKTHLTMDQPTIVGRGKKATIVYLPIVACGKDPDTVDADTRISNVDCLTCLAWIKKRET